MRNAIYNKTTDRSLSYRGRRLPVVGNYRQFQQSATESSGKDLLNCYRSNEIQRALLLATGRVDTTIQSTSTSAAVCQLTFSSPLYNTKETSFYHSQTPLAPSLSTVTSHLRYSWPHFSPTSLHTQTSTRNTRPPPGLNMSPSRVTDWSTRATDSTAARPVAAVESATGTGTRHLSVPRLGTVGRRAAVSSVGSAAAWHSISKVGISISNEEDDKALRYTGHVVPI